MSPARKAFAAAAAVAMLAGAGVAWRARAAHDRERAGPLLSEKSAGLQRDYERRKYAWMERNIVEAYAKNGRREAWKEKGGALLEGFCKYETRQEGYPDVSALAAQARALVDAGCDDPLVRSWCLVAFRRAGRFKEAAECQEWLHRSNGDAELSAYPAVNLFYGANAIIEMAFEQGRMFDVSAWRPLTFNLLGQALAQGTFQSGESQIAYRLTDEMDADIFPGNVKWSVVETILAKDPNHDPWLMKMAEGQSYVVLAWGKRGGGFGYETSPEAAGGFQEDLGKARTALTAAWKMRPEYPEAAEAMIPVALAGEGKDDDGVWLWFNRAIRAQWDYAPAYDQIIDMAILPRWGGSYEEMESFGLECLGTKRHDTVIPLYYLKALRRIGSDMDNEKAWAGIFGREDVRANLEGLFKDLMARPDWARDRRRLAAQLAYARLWAGDAAGADALFRDVPKDLDLKNGFLGGPLSFRGQDRSHADAELKLLKGPRGDDYRRARSLLYDDRLKEAVPLLEKIFESGKDDPVLRVFLRDKLSKYRLFMNHGDINAIAGEPELHLAVRFADLPEAEFQADNGADVNGRDVLGRTPLRSAVEMEDASTLRPDDVDAPALFASLEKRRDVDLLLIPLISSAPGPSGAVRYDVLEPLNDLLRMPDLCRRVDVRGLPVPKEVRLLLARAERSGAKGEDGLDERDVKTLNKVLLSLLYPGVIRSTYGRHMEVLRFLLAKGADPDAYANDGLSPMAVAVDWNNPEMLSLLLAKGGDPDGTYPDGWPFLRHALMNRRSESSALLIKAGADIGAPVGAERMTALHHAAKFDSGLVPLLLARGARVDAVDFEGNTPLHLAAAADNPRILLLLLGHRSALESRNAKGFTPLLSALNAKAAEAAAALIAQGADIEAADKEGWRPIHFAAYHGLEGVVDLLLRRGAAKGVELPNHMTPADIAKKQDNPRIAALLAK